MSPVFLGELFGGIIGGALLSLVFSGIIERFAFRSQEPDVRATSTVGLAWFIIAVIAGFGFANGNGFSPSAGLLYLPGAAIVWFWYRRRFRQLWLGDQTTDENDR
jgi:mannose/fructose/N-acetylgalactosamine-specific phosphotransferase system component IIC